LEEKQLSFINQVKLPFYGQVVWFLQVCNNIQVLLYMLRRKLSDAWLCCDAKDDGPLERTFKADWRNGKEELLNFIVRHEIPRHRRETAI
jgi:hypothetical protein